MLALPRTVRSLAVSAALALVAGVVGPGTVVAAPDPGLAARLDRVLADSRVQRADSGSIVLDGRTGERLYDRRGVRRLTPASNVKLLTAAAALDRLGPGYRFRTEVIRRGTVSGGVLRGRLYLKGYGDPTSRVADYQSLARQVRAAGIRRVTSSLAVDASYFDAVRYSPYWSRGYASAYYAAQVSGLTFAPNADLDTGTVLVRYAPGRSGRSAAVSVVPAAAARYVRVRNLTTTTRSGTSPSVRVERTPGTNTVVVRGRVPRGRTAATRLVTVHRPELIAAAVFRSALAEAGVTVAGSDKTIVTPATRRTVVALDRSMTVAQLMVPFLKLSNNIHGETLTKAMSARGGRTGTWAGGLAATRAYLTRLGVPSDEVRLVDGSGLARGNELTPRALAALLYRVQREPWFASFSAGLPVAGHPTRMVGGTLRHRMVGTAAARNARAKTGTLTGVTALSGYVTGRDGRRYVFAMVSEHSGTSPRPVENTFVATLAGWR